MYKSLQSSRAIAAMMVVLYHLGGTIASGFGINSFATPFSFGYAGVPFFFVLSGFIIFFAHQNDIFKPDRFASYIKKRLLRIYPTYWIVFLAVFLFAIASSVVKNAAPQVPLDSIVLLKALLLIPQDPKIVGGTGAPVIAVAWTLQYEMFFYLFFACLILSRWLSIVVVCALAYICISNTMEVSDSSFIFSFLSKYMVLFLMGMAVAFIHKSKNLIVKKPQRYTSIGLLIFLSVVLSDLTGIDMAQRTLFYGVASSLIIFGLVRSEDKGPISGGGLMQRLGDSSYALYLIHYPMIGILCKLFISMQLNKLGLLGAIIAYVIIFCTCIIGSLILNVLIEKPIAAFFKRRRTNKAAFI